MPVHAVSSGTIRKHERAPETDEEWDLALQGDVESPIASSSSPSTPSPLAIFQRRPLLEHRDNTQDRLTEPLPHAQAPRSRHASGSVSTSSVHRVRERRSASTASHGSSSRRSDPTKERPMAVGLAEHMPFPKHASDWIDGDEMQAVSERKRLRLVYEAEGWLPGPRPGQQRRLKRRKALRRLGLTQGERGRRQEVMSKYADMARRLFGTAGAFVGILFDDVEITYSGEDGAEPIRWDLGHTLCRHAVQSAHEQCMIVSDLTKDWRYAKNPSTLELGSRFFVCAPLRYHLHDDWVDFGCIVLHDPEPRDEFSLHQQTLLLDYASMLVYQLTTLQSEVSARLLSDMYSDMISFLRRAMMPDPKANRKKAIPAPDPNANQDPVVQPADVVMVEDTTRRSTMRHGTTKTGLEGNMAIRRQMQQFDRDLFTDAAETLQRLLQADKVAIVSNIDHHLYIRRLNPDLPMPRKSETKERLVGDVLAGKPWPPHLKPVVVYRARSNQTGLQVLGQAGQGELHLHGADAPETISVCIESFFKLRRYWYAQDDEDELGPRVKKLMPEGSHTTLALCWLNYDGALKFTMLVSWNEPPVMFGSAAKALPFAWIVAGLTACALAIRSVRNIEQSQITYSNFQAHELRTPMHQILATTQLLRSTMTELAAMPNPQQLGLHQLQDFLPYLDAIDTSGNVLQGIVDNILNFLDLRGGENLQHGLAPNLMDSPSGPAQPLGMMLDQVIRQVIAEDRRGRRSTGRPLGDIEAVLEINPPQLGRDVTEDTGGAMRNAVSKLLSNAFKFIENVGCVEVHVDFAEDVGVPDDVEELSATKLVSVRILDNGCGMSEDFVMNKLGEPWAKGDTFATGSGLSVHLAWRVIDLMGGYMEISSTPGKGTTVQLEVPLPRRDLSSPSSPGKGQNVNVDDDKLALVEEKPMRPRKVALVGFEPDSQHPDMARVGQSLARQYSKLGCDVTTDLQQTDLVVLDGRQQDGVAFPDVLARIRTDDVVILVRDDYRKTSPVVSAAETQSGKQIRRLCKPITPALVHESLCIGSTSVGAVPRPSRSSSGSSDSNGESRSPNGGDAGAEQPEGEGNHFKPRRSSFSGGEQVVRGVSDTSWVPAGLTLEDAIAALSLGNLPAKRRRSTRSSLASMTSTPAVLDAPLPADPVSGLDELGFTSPDPPEQHPPSVGDAGSPGTGVVTVLVVEDNLINRKILVKLLEKEDGIQVLQAEEGLMALEMFRSFRSPSIVLLDINMPKMDGYQAAHEMRRLEWTEGRDRSTIVAVTAMSSEEERRKGLHEAGMDAWLTKPCSKMTLISVVREAKRAILAGAEPRHQAESSA